jgi:argininosuccinate lyase
MPLGSGALAGNPLSINRSLLAKDLGFAKLTYNSMNAVGNRDFIGQAAVHFSCNIRKKGGREGRRCVLAVNAHVSVYY